MLKNCSATQYFNTTLGTCDDCDSSCTSCSSKYNCSTCANVSFLYPYVDNNNNSYRLCVDSCPDIGTVGDISTGKCANCSAGCYTCDTPNTCSQCNPYTIFNSIDQQCYCDFKYNLYTAFDNSSVLVDTYNLLWNP